MRECKKCGNTHDESFFTKKKTNKDGLSTRCKDCTRAKVRQHYLDNKRYYKEKSNDSRDKCIDFITRVKKKNGCQKCGESRYWVLDFHHTKEKTEDISTLVYKGSMKKLKNEIRKCILVCSNCHRDIHYQEKRV